MIVMTPKQCHQNRKSPMIVIASNKSQPMKKRIVIIMIPEGCPTRMTIIMMILKMRIQKRIILFSTAKKTNKNSLMVILILTTMK